MADAGRVLLMPKGTYSASTNYEVLDWVRYSNGTYASKHNNNQGNTPTGNPTDPHWALLCQDGSGGGSTVAWTQIQATGTKIATVEIDGVQTDVYAPTGGGSSYSAGTGIDISNNTISIDPGTITSGNQKPVTGDAVNTALSSKADTSSLGDLAYINKDGASSTKVLQGDGTWVTPSSGGHTMINNSGYESTMVTHAADPTDDDVASAYVIANWSNCAAKVILTTVAQGDDTVGQWNDTWKTDGVRTGWLWSADLYHVLEDGSGNRNYDVEVIPVFDAGDSETISLYGYRIDDDVTNDGTPGGAIAFKLNSAVQSATGIKVGVKLVLQRTEVNPTGTIIT